MGDVTQTENDKTNSMRRRNSKKKKKVHRPRSSMMKLIKLCMKSNLWTQKKRIRQKKTKKSSEHTDEQSKGEIMKPSKDIDTGNMADVQKENVTVPVKITSSFSCESL